MHTESLKNRANPEIEIETINIENTFIHVIILTQPKGLTQKVATSLVCAGDADRGKTPALVLVGCLSTRLFINNQSS